MKSKIKIYAGLFLLSLGASLSLKQVLSPQHKELAHHVEPLDLNVPTKTNLIEAEPPQNNLAQNHLSESRLDMGERAFFLPLKEAPKLMPNDRIDLVMTQKIKKIKDGMVKENIQSQIILSYARVLELSEKQGIVLAVPHTEITKLALAQEIGKLSFVKYPDVAEEIVTLPSLTKEKDIALLKKKPKQPEITLIRGKQVEQHVFQ